MAEEIKKNTKVTIGVCGSVSVNEPLRLARDLLKSGYQIKFVITKNASRLHSLKQFKKITYEVYTGLYSQNESYQDILRNENPVIHLQIAQDTDIYIIYPATANFVGKLANGIYNDVLTNSIGSSLAPKILVPTVNWNMWQNSAFQRNIRFLKKDGFIIIPPIHEPQKNKASNLNYLADYEDVKIALKATLETL